MRCNLSAKEVASQLGVSVNTLLNWERGRYEAPGSQLSKLANIYHCSVDYLLGRTEERVS